MATGTGKTYTVFQIIYRLLQSNAKRERFNEMIEDGKLGLFDLVITKEVLRVTRNTLDSIRFSRKLLSNGVAVYFQSDNINTLDEDSELRLTIMSSMAQDESRKISNSCNKKNFEILNG